MADPKYADLPGIALDEPDIFETSDLPEADQSAADFYEEESNVVERIHISSTEAFNKFKGKMLESGKVDFSDRISKHLRTGYDARSGDWELIPKGEKETPLQKYQRLQCEMKELFEDVKNITHAEQDSTSCLVTGEQVQIALKKLADLRLEETLGQDVVSSIMDPQGTQIKKLLAQLESFKMNANDQPESEGNEGDNITYKLNFRPEQAKLVQTSRVAELERRLHRLENVLGANSDKLTRITVATNKSSLLEAAQHLSATASMLDSAQLDHIEGRLTALSQKLDAIDEKKKSSSEDSDQMILELYNLVKNSENISKVLPQTVERLKALEALHSKATDFTTTLAQVEALQGDIQESVHNNKSLLQCVQESFAMNLDEINKTVISLDARIKAFKKK